MQVNDRATKLAANSTPLRAIGRIAFILYAIILAVATHMPGIAVEGPIPRSDLVLHVIGFAVWSGLLYLTGWLGRPGWLATVTPVAAVAVAYGIVDEAAQAIPWLHRVFDVTDMAANAAGGILGAAIAFAAVRTMSVLKLRRAQ